MLNFANLQIEAAIFALQILHNEKNVCTGSCTNLYYCLRPKTN